jgi:hypothetical protein
MGLDPSGYELEAYGDEWGASVTAWRLLDGRRSPLSTNFGFGAEGALTWAGGALATPVRGADYPLVGTDAAVQRLNDDQAGWLAISGGGSIASRNAGTPTAEAAPASGAGEECPTPAPDVQLPNPGPDVPVSSDASASAGSAGAPCVPPVASSLPTRVTVTLTKVANDLSTVWDQAGNVWVLPAYTFQDDNGASYTVLAVADQYVEVGKS